MVPIINNSVLEGHHVRLSIHKSQRIKILSLVYVTLLISLIIGLYIPISMEYAEYLVDLYNETMVKEYMMRKGFTNKTFFIVSHNLRVLLLASAPIIGPVLMYYSAFSAGMILNALVLTSAGKLSRLQVLVSSLSMPHTWIELLAFSLTTSECILVSLRLLRKAPLKDEVFYLVVILIVSVSLLLLSATLETLSVITLPEK